MYHVPWTIVYHSVSFCIIMHYSELLVQLLFLQCALCGILPQLTRPLYTGVTSHDIPSQKFQKEAVKKNNNLGKIQEKHGCWFPTGE